MPRYRLALLVLALLAAAACAQDATPLLADPGFDRVGADLAPWQVRYAIKASEPDSRPRWAAELAQDDERGTHLHLRQVAPAAGTVYLGQRVRLPETLPPLEWSVDAQTFCPMEGRSGGVDLVILAPDAWDGLAAEPEAAKNPPDELWRKAVHANRDDLTTWRRLGLTPYETAAALAPYAGREVVLGVAWSTWHPTSDEWARFDNLYLGPPRPRIDPLDWPLRAYRGHPLTFRVRVSGLPGAAPTFRYRGGGEWTELAPAPRGEGLFEAVVPAEQVVEGLEAQATVAGPEGPLSTPVEKVTLMTRPEHPSLFYNRAELDAMAAKAEQFEWARDRIASVRRAADAWLDRPVDPPTEPGGWSHDYVDPDTGARLQFREDHPHDHLSPKTGKTYQGEKLDATWRSYMHGRWSGAARNLAMTYALSGDERYGRKAAEILAWYADHYADFPPGKGPAGKGRVHSQSLTEATWLLGMMEAADLVYPVMTAEQRRKVEQDLILAGAEWIRQFRFGIHNIQCWHNACYAAAGYFLGSPDMVEAATTGPLGFTEQVAKGILPDGSWYERSLGYHYYTLDALVAHAEAARHAGSDLYRNDALQAMFTLPLRLALPNLVPPSLNDQSYSTGPVRAEPLERAVAWYDDETAAQALKLLTETTRYNRVNDTALQYGESLEGVGEYTPPASEDLPGAGFAVLRRGQGDAAVQAMLEYGEHGGGHGHPDKLQLILYAAGRPLAPDPGTTGYGVALHGRWFKTTPGHNTVTIGHASQKATTGKLLHFEAGDDRVVAVAESTGAYPGYRLERRLELTADRLADVFTVEGEEAADLDWFLRAPGELTLDLPLQPLNEKAPNATYAYLEDLRGATTDGAWTATWTLEDGTRYTVTGVAAPGTQVAIAMAPGIPGERWPILRVRRHAPSTRFEVSHAWSR